MFFSSWDSILRILFIGTFGYVALIAILRLSGNRTLSKMNSFDFIITIALGSCFATSILQKSVALIDAMGAFVFLVGIQYITTWLSFRSKTFESWIKSQPVLLFSQGEFHREAMKRAHVTEDEVIAGMRQAGYLQTDQVGYVFLETNGKIITIEKKQTAH